MGEFGPEIETGDLMRSHVPQLNPSSPDVWQVFARFALSFDGYTRLGKACGSVANGWLRTYRESGELPADPETIRACLFYEQRRWRHFQIPPDREAWTYLNALLSALRSILPE